MGFLDDLIGLKNVIDPNGTTMPRRYALSFEGSSWTIEDDDENEQTIIRLGGAGVELGELETLDIPLEEDDFVASPTGISTANVLRLSSETDGWHLIGIDVEAGLAVRRKILLNVGDEPINIGKLGAETPAGAPIIVPGGSLELPPNGAIEVIWLPDIGESFAGWRAL